MLQAAVGTVRTSSPLRHAVLLQLQNQDAHQQGFCLRRTHPAQIHNDVSVEELPIGQFVFGAENLSVDAVGKGFKTGKESACVIALGVLGEALAVHNIGKSRPDIPEGGEIPTSGKAFR